MIDTVLSRAEQLPECLAVGYADMRSGVLLGFRSVESHPHQVIALLAAATSDLFHGKHLIAMDAGFRGDQPYADDPGHSFTEIVVFSENLLHAFLRPRQSSHHALVVVCRASANVPLVLAGARKSLLT